MDRITTSFGAHSTAREVTRGVDLSGKRVIITGGASGIGIETTRTFAQLGADVTVAVRDPSAALPTVGELIAATGNHDLRVRRLDLADQGSVAEFVGRWSGPLHVLVNNAGIMATPQLERTVEGWELQFATNHLGHFALAVGLRPALAESGNARIVSVSSSGHLFSPVVFDDLHFDFRPYDPLVAYGQSKTASTLFAVGASARWARDGIIANAVMPGAIATNLQRHTGGLRTPVERRKTPQQGAATTLFAATSPLLEGISGRYFEDVNEAATVAERLWDVSRQLLG